MDKKKEIKKNEQLKNIPSFHHNHLLISIDNTLKKHRIYITYRIGHE